MPLNQEQKDFINKIVINLIAIPADPNEFQRFILDLKISLQTPNNPPPQMTRVLEIIYRPGRYFQGVEKLSSDTIFTDDIQLVTLATIHGQIIGINNNRFDITELAEKFRETVNVIARTYAGIPFRPINFATIGELPPSAAKCYQYFFDQDENNRVSLHVSVNTKKHYKKIFCQTVHAIYDYDDALAYVENLKQQFLSQTRKFVWDILFNELKSIFLLTESDKNTSWLKAIFRLLENEYYLRLALSGRLRKSTLKQYSLHQIKILDHPYILYLITCRLLSMEAAANLNASLLSRILNPNLFDLITTKWMTIDQLALLTNKQISLLLTEVFFEAARQERKSIHYFLGLSDKQCDFLLQPTTWPAFLANKINFQKETNVPDELLNYLLAHPKLLGGNDADLFSLQSVLDNPETLYHYLMKYFAQRLINLILKKDNNDRLETLMLDIPDLLENMSKSPSENQSNIINRFISYFERHIIGLSDNKKPTAISIELGKPNAHHSESDNENESETSDEESDLYSSSDSIEIQLTDETEPTPETITVSSSEACQALLENIRSAKLMKNLNWLDALGSLIDTAHIYKRPPGKIPLNRYSPTYFVQPQSIQDICSNLIKLRPLSRLNHDFASDISMSYRN